MIPAYRAIQYRQAGFFRFAAYNINDSESWHNYAACRQLAYGDYAGASECYLKAIEINPRDSTLQVRAVCALDGSVEKSGAEIRRVRCNRATDQPINQPGPRSLLPAHGHDVSTRLGSVNSLFTAMKPRNDSGLAIFLSEQEI